MKEPTENDPASKKSIKQKWISIFRYNKLYIGFLVLIILVLIYIGDVVYRSSKEFVLQGFIANDEKNIFNAEQLSKDMQTYLGLEKHQIAVFDDSLFVVFDKADHYIESSISKIYAYMAAKELDFLIAPRSVAEHYAANLPLLDFKDLLSDEFNDQVMANLQETMSFDGENGMYLLSMSSSRFAKTTDLYMIVPKEAPHQQTLRQFIRFAFLVEE